MLYKDTIQRVLKQVHPNTNIGGSARNYVGGYIIERFYRVISYIMKTKYNGEEITRDILLDILQVLIDGELYKHAFNEITKYEAKKNNGEISNALCICYDANLKSIKKFFKDINISPDVLSLLLPCMEYLLAEFFELAGNACRDNRKTVIDTYHIFIATIGDQELDELTIRMHCSDTLKQQYQISLDMLKYLGEDPK